MKLTKEMRAALDVVADAITEAWNETCSDEFDEEFFAEEDPDMTLKQFTLDDWIDNGYDALDNVSDYLNSEVNKKLS